MERSKYTRLITRRFLSESDLEQCIRDAKESGRRIEDVLLGRGVPKHELLLSLSAFYGRPWLEYDESVIVSQHLTRRMDMERLKAALWLPLSASGNRAEVIVSAPDDPMVLDDIRSTLGVDQLEFRIALPGDLVRIIEHNQDLNPRFPPAAGRTPLAKVRTHLANRRSTFACHRTALAKGRTGLAFLRTGLSFISIALVLFRFFGTGYFVTVEAMLLVVGLAAVVDGLIWYVPGRKLGRQAIICLPTEPTGGTSVLTVQDPGRDSSFRRTAQVEGASAVRQQWERLSPIMRRRFLASDRTDLAEERTILACYRTVMAFARTGLAFTRTGVAFIGLGLGLLRQSRTGPWSIVDGIIIFIGALMVAEGLHWYLPGRKAGLEGARAVKAAEGRQSIWDEVFPFLAHHRAFSSVTRLSPPVRGYQSPGIWGTTGVALERTLLAERRNVMARLRTVMARSRTGMAFIRTGMSVASVGLGLLVYFGTGILAWTVFESGMIAAGMLSIADGLFWYLPAERTRRQFPYCFGDVEISIPDYGVPARSWRRAVFSHDDV